LPVRPLPRPGESTTARGRSAKMGGNSKKGEMMEKGRANDSWERRRLFESLKLPLGSSKGKRSPGGRREGKKK